MGSLLGLGGVGVGLLCLGSKRRKLASEREGLFRRQGGGPYRASSLPQLFHTCYFLFLGAFLLLSQYFTRDLLWLGL